MVDTLVDIAVVLTGMEDDLMLGEELLMNIWFSVVD